MRNFFSKVSTAHRFLFAILAGLMLAVSFPKFSVSGFAWIAPGVILFCGIGKSGRQRFWIGYVAGLAHFLLSLNWLLSIPFPAGAVAAWLALSGYLAVYLALWVWLCWRIFPKPGPGFTLKEFSNSTWWQRARWSFCCALLWIAFEMCMARMFTGFPWNFLGITQYKLAPLIQVASVTGVYGVSFLVVWFSVSLGSAWLLLVQRPGSSRFWCGEILLPTLVSTIIFAIGASRISPDRPEPRQFKLALVQPSIPQTLIFDPSQDETRFNRLIQLSEMALAEKPNVLVWPEASTPPLDQNKFDALTRMIASNHVWMVIGSDDVSASPTKQGDIQTNYYNGSFLFGPDGTIVARYHKRRLVIFGEYIPLMRWLPFTKWLTPIEGGFTAGPGPVPFQMEEPRAKTSVLICFEDAFPQYAREHVETDTDFLLNLTNDGWFGERSAQWQQAANALFRAVENGLPIVRCTNNGLTCWADKFGRLRKYFSSRSGDVYGPGFLIAQIPLLDENEHRAPTFYRQHGDWFGWGCVGSSLLLIGFSFRKKREVPPASV
ncbi:MAG: apolipoprotein N-acyltransferase [Verrucomicrobiota bacterium]